MKTWVRKTLSVGVLAAGALLFAPGAAHAGVAQDTSDNNGIANGLQLVAPVNIPISAVGNAIGVAGEANAAGSVINRTEGGWVNQDSSDNNGILNGAQAYLPINIPISVVGNAVGVLGEANAAGAVVNGHGRKAESGHVGQHGWPVDQDTSDNNGILNGAQIYAPVDIPINVCGNSLALLGEANAQAICGNSDRGRSTESGWAVNQKSSDNNGILNGAQIYAPVHLPVNLAGNSAALLGEANSAAVVHNESARTHGFDQDSSDNNGIGNGLQIAAPVHIPVNICGNALGILGEANAAAACGDSVGGGHGGHGHGGHGGHGNGGNNGHGHDGNGGDNGQGDYAGNNGNQDGQYAGDHGHKGNGGAQGNGGTSYGSKTDSDGGRMGTSATEASPVDGLTRGVGGVGGVGLGGLDLLNTLR
jgi:hypothetical protein